MSRIRKGADVLTFQRHMLSWLQREGPAPDSPLELFSLYGAMGGFEEPQGEPEPRFRKSLSQRRGFRKVGESYGTPEASTTSFTEGMPRASATLLSRLKQSGEKFSVQVLVDQDADPEDPTKWQSKIIFEGVTLTSYKSSGALEGFDSDDEVTVEAEASYDARADVFPIQFGPVAATEITVPVLAAAVYPPDDRGNHARKEIYLVTAVDATNPYLVWTQNGGLTWTATAITALTTAPTDIAVVGSFILITSQAGNCYVYARRSAPATLTKVTGGFVATKGPNAIYAISLANVFMVGNGGYIYKLTLPGQPVTVINAGVATTQNLNDIAGFGDVLVAVGAANAMVASYNGGKSWSLLTGPEAATALNCVAIQNTEQQEIWWAGGAKLSYSKDHGATWTEKVLGVTPTTVNDIAFCDELDSVGAVAYTATGPVGGVLYTSDGGELWENEHCTDLPTCQGVAALAWGGPNYLVAAGDSNGTDGFAAIALSA